MIVIYFNLFISKLVFIEFKVLILVILLWSSFINSYNDFKLILYFDSNSNIEDINIFNLSYYIVFINSFNYNYFSLLLNPKIWYSDNFNMILKNDIPKEYISHNSGLN